ncbi:MAG TPA: OmpH family outer membrane protein [Syntrophales bacterium]|nr:OmpH family outer membrane protein [Syntrophales bacterium]HON22422.1 OmpH family outer membrane protein [Syntrophales bacterium]HOU77549.1 OmpH family outer membrane protein [Syntrophales bacterium]HPC31476.1 OmpH family outer membrane protein [Syntrophales bacterium]HQG35134.1 OmpH family outer membrane protein [Syntrophales bacterium]
MKRYLLIIVVFIVFSIVSLPVWAAPPRGSGGSAAGKIGIVDMQKVLRESKNARNYRTAFLKELESKQALIKAKEEAVKKIEEELKNLAPTAVTDHKKKAEQLKQETRNLQHLREDAEGELKRKDAEITQKVISEIMQVIQSYARNERYTVVLDRMAVITADENTDITSRIIKLYDSQNK